MSDWVDGLGSTRRLIRGYDSRCRSRHDASMADHTRTCTGPAGLQPVTAGSLGVDRESPGRRAQPVATFN
jgi:hypothetical protein